MKKRVCKTTCFLRTYILGHRRRVLILVIDKRELCGVHIAILRRMVVIRETTEY
jgi:hypothetical protein